MAACTGDSGRQVGRRRQRQGREEGESSKRGLRSWLADREGQAQVGEGQVHWQCPVGSCRAATLVRLPWDTCISLGFPEEALSVGEDREPTAFPGSRKQVDSLLCKLVR